jgi:hypothetical protein
MSEPTIPSETKSPPAPSGVGRLAWVRHFSSGDAPSQPIGALINRTWWTALVQEISARGVGLALPRQLMPGTMLAVDLQGLLRFLTVRVIRATPQAEGSWIVHCEFLSKPTDDELEVLLL